MVKYRTIHISNRSTCNYNQLYTNNGFTLVEILIVVIILGTLASIIIPKFSTATEQARDSMLKENLKNVRTQISIYRIQHLDVPPGVDASGNVTTDLFVSHLTGFSDYSGNTSANRSAQYKLGPYLSRIPTNPINSKSSVAVMNTIPNSCPGNDGWIYVADSATFIADLSGNAPDGKSYLDY